jgi:hypothetical protein
VVSPKMLLRFDDTPKPLHTFDCCYRCRFHCCCLKSSLPSSLRETRLLTLLMLWLQIALDTEGTLEGAQAFLQANTPPKRQKHCKTQQNSVEKAKTLPNTVGAAVAARGAESGMTPALYITMLVIGISLSLVTHRPGPSARRTIVWLGCSVSPQPRMPVCYHRHLPSPSLPRRIRH